MCTLLCKTQLKAKTNVYQKESESLEEIQTKGQKIYIYIYGHVTPHQIYSRSQQVLDKSVKCGMNLTRMAALGKLRNWACKQGWSWNRRGWMFHGKSYWIKIWKWEWDQQGCETVKKQPKQNCESISTNAEESGRAIGWGWVCRTLRVQQKIRGKEPMVSRDTSFIYG